MLMSRCWENLSVVRRESGPQRERILTRINYHDQNAHRTSLALIPHLGFVSSTNISRADKSMGSSNSIKTNSHRPFRRKLPVSCIETVLGYLETPELVRVISQLTPNKADSLRSVMGRLIRVRLATCSGPLIYNVIGYFARQRRSRDSPRRIMSDADCSDLLLDTSRTCHSKESQNQLAYLLRRVCGDLGCSYVQGMNMVVAGCLTFSHSME